MESATVLSEIKSLLGLATDYSVFDRQILIHINTAVLTLKQLNIITPIEVGDLTMWADFEVTNQGANITAIKSLVYYKVWLAFDPPVSSSLTESIQNQMRELEFRLLVEADVDPYAEA